MTEKGRLLWIVVLSLAAATAVFVVVCRFVAATPLEANGAYEGGFRVADVLLETELVKSYWLGEIDSPYDRAEQAGVLQTLGSGGSLAPAFTMISITLVLLAPFVTIARSNVTVAYRRMGRMSFGIFRLVVPMIYSRIDLEDVHLRALRVIRVLSVIGSRME